MDRVDLLPLFGQGDIDDACVLLAAQLFDIAFFDQLVDGDGDRRQGDAKSSAISEMVLGLFLPFLRFQHVHLVDAQVRMLSDRLRIVSSTLRIER